MTDRNNRTLTYNYDALNRQTTETWLDGNDNPIHQFQYQYDAASQTTAAFDPNSSYNYQYDNVGNLIQIDSNNTNTPQVSFKYQYDAVNNPTRTTEVTDGINTAITNYTYDELNRVSKR